MSKRCFCGRHKRPFPDMHGRGACAVSVTQDLRESFIQGFIRGVEAEAHWDLPPAETRLRAEAAAKEFNHDRDDAVAEVRCEYEAKLAAASARAEKAEASAKRWREEKLAGEGPLWDRVLAAEARLREVARRAGEVMPPPPHKAETWCDCAWCLVARASRREGEG